MHVDYSSSLTSEDVSVSTIQELSPFFTKSLYSILTDHAYSWIHYITLRDKDISLPHSLHSCVPDVTYHSCVPVAATSLTFGSIPATTSITPATLANTIPLIPFDWIIATKKDIVIVYLD
jgi:hypothetical protein